MIDGRTLPVTGAGGRSWRTGTADLVAKKGYHGAMNGRPEPFCPLTRWSLRGAIVAGVALAILVLLPGVSVAKKTKCFPREGHCLAVTVNGQTAKPIEKQTKKSLRALGDVSHYVDDARYELDAPIDGALDVVADKVTGSDEWFGDGREVRVQIVPLDPVEIATDQHLVSSPTVRVEGRAAAGVANVMRDDTLPPGRYLLRVRLRGAGNWDRQTVFVTVSADD